MIILRAIGAFFVRIWRWIKETAWVQPLLIVGVIFGIIFSIPSITSWIQGIAEQMNSSTTYYKNLQYSLEMGSDGKSDADELVEDILARMGEDGYQESKKDYPDKFFLVFVSETCTSCESAKAGFAAFQNRFNDTLAPKNSAYPFELITIFTDEVTDQTTSQESAFVQFLTRRQSFFFETAASVGRESDYYLNKGISDSDLTSLESVDPDSFLTPTILLIDFTPDTASQGISEVMFGVTGEGNNTEYDKGKLLLQCWDHSGKFSDKIGD